MRALTASLALSLLLAGSSFALAAEGGPTGAPSGQQQEPNANPAGTAGSGTSSQLFTEAQIKRALEQDGYTNVTGLKEGTDGAWTGRARHAGKDVTIDIDRNGMVTAR